jgi:Tol biopolymer transport system component
VFHPIDSNRLVFTSKANNLGAADVNGADEDIYVRDMAAGATSLISIDSSGLTSGNDASTNPVLNADGTRVAFESFARNLVAGRELIVSGNIFVRDLVTGTTSLVSQDAAGREMVTYWAEDPAISPDGGLVAFTTSGNNLGPEDDDSDRDVYVRDLAAGTNHLVSTNAGSHADLAVFSPDGSMIAYTSGLAFLDRTADGSLTVVNSADTDTPMPQIEHPAFSPDSDRLAFATFESLVRRDTLGLTHDVYVVDVGSNWLELVSANETQTAGGDHDSSRSRAPVFSPDGGAIAYDSQASDSTGPTRTAKAATTRSSRWTMFSSPALSSSRPPMSP